MISAKNVPLFAGGDHKKKIVAGLYDCEANLIVTADELGNILFNNFNIKSTNWFFVFICMSSLMKIRLK